MKKFFYPQSTHTNLLSWISLILRVIFGLTMIFSHGWRKCLKIFNDDPIKFSDPIGLGEPMSLYLTVFAEVICAALLAIGLFTRGVILPLLFTMLVAIFIVHWAQPFAKKELALIYATGYVVIFLIGPGKFSLDYFLFGNKTNV